MLLFTNCLHLFRMAQIQAARMFVMELLLLMLLAEQDPLFTHGVTVAAHKLLQGFVQAHIL